MIEADPRWYESFFDDDWLVIALGHDDERTQILARRVPS